MKQSTVQIREVILPNDKEDVKRLWFEYLTWGNGQMQLLYGHFVQLFYN